MSNCFDSLLGWSVRRRGADLLRDRLRLLQPVLVTVEAREELYSGN